MGKKASVKTTDGKRREVTDSARVGGFQVKDGKGGTKETGRENWQRGTYKDGK